MVLRWLFGLGLLVFYAIWQDSVGILEGEIIE